MDTLTMNKVAPQKRFSSFNSNWMTKLYGDVYSFYSTNSLSRDKLNYESGEVFNIHYGDIHTKFSTLFDLTKELVPLINIEVDLSKYSEEKYCQEGDLVIADASEDYADIGKTIELINLNNERILAGLHTFLARPNKDEIARGFAGYLMQSWKVRKQVMVIAQGSKVLGLATGRLGKVKLCIPEFKEQQKIASFLTAVDDKLQQLTKKKDLLEEYKKGVMQKIFSQELRFKDEFGNNYPDWEKKKLGDLIDLVIDNRGKTPPITDEGIYLIEVNAIGRRNINYSKIKKFVSSNTFESWFRKYLEQGDILFSTVGNTAVCSLYQERHKAGIAQNIVGLRFKDDDSTFMYYLLTEPLNNHKFKRIEMGAVQPSVKVSQMIHIFFSIPCLKEQQKIANFLTSLDSKIESVSTQIENTKDFKKGLLQQMFV